MLAWQDKLYGIRVPNDCFSHFFNKVVKSLSGFLAAPDASRVLWAVKNNGTKAQLVLLNGLRFI